MNTQVTQYINDAPDEQKEIMKIIRSIIHNNVAGVTEDYKWSRPVFSKSKDFAYFKITKTHLTLGFMNFEKISDPNSLLEGSGKEMRHIKLKKPSDIDHNQLADWFLKVSE